MIQAFLESAVVAQVPVGVIYEALLLATLVLCVGIFLKEVSAEITSDYSIVDARILATAHLARDLGLR